MQTAPTVTLEEVNSAIDTIRTCGQLEQLVLACQTLEHAAEFQMFAGRFGRKCARDEELWIFNKVAETGVDAMLECASLLAIGEAAAKVCGSCLYNLIELYDGEDRVCELKHRWAKAGMAEFLVQRMRDSHNHEETLLAMLCRNNEEAKRRSASARVLDLIPKPPNHQEELKEYFDTPPGVEGGRDYFVSLHTMLLEYDNRELPKPPPPASREASQLLQRLGELRIDAPCLCPQQQVVVSGLNARKDLNGLRGRILGPQADGGRWPVQVYMIRGGFEQVRMKSSNLEVYMQPIFELLDDDTLEILLLRSPPATTAQLLCCARSTARLALWTWNTRFRRLSPQWEKFARRQLSHLESAEQWREKYAQALSRERKANALLAAEPNPKNLRGINVCEEYATLRAILDSPAQVRPEMSTYEGFLGQFKQTSTALGAALFQKGGRDLMVAFHESYVHEPLARRTMDYAWACVDGAGWDY